MYIHINMCTYVYIYIYIYIYIHILSLWGAWEWPGVAQSSKMAREQVRVPLPPVRTAPRNRDGGYRCRLGRSNTFVAPRALTQRAPSSLVEGAAGETAEDKQAPPALGAVGAAVALSAAAGAAAGAARRSRARTSTRAQFAGAAPSGLGASVPPQQARPGFVGAAAPSLTPEPLAPGETRGERLARGMKLAYWMYTGPAHIGTLRVASSFKNVHAIMHAPLGDDYFNVMRSMLERSRDFTPVTASIVDRHVLARGSQEKAPARPKFPPRGGARQRVGRARRGPYGEAGCGFGARRGCEVGDRRSSVWSVNAQSADELSGPLYIHVTYNILC